MPSVTDHGLDSHDVHAFFIRDILSAFPYLVDVQEESSGNTLLTTAVMRRAAMFTLFLMIYYSPTMSTPRDDGLTSYDLAVISREDSTMFQWLIDASDIIREARVIIVTHFAAVESVSGRIADVCLGYVGLNLARISDDEHRTQACCIIL